MQRKSKLSSDLKFLFKYAEITVSTDEEMYSSEEKARIEEIISNCSKNIEIDKTYVDFKDTPYEKTFMTETGWKKFCKLVRKTQFGNKCTKIQHAELQENYSLMMICYLYLLLEDFGYDCAGICLEIKEQSRFMVQIFNDTAKTAEYAGKWQTWNSDYKSRT